MELLKKLLDEETYAKVEEQLKGKDIKLANLKEGQYVSLEKYNTLNGDLETTQNELKQRTQDLTELKKLEGLNEETMAKLEKLENDFKTKEQEYQSQLKQNEKKAYLDRVVLGSKTIDEVSVQAHVQTFIKDKEFKDGKYEGLEEYIDTLKEEKSYLFEKKPQATGGSLKNPPKEETIRDEVFKGFGVK